MTDDFDWLSVLQNVFKKYGTHLHKNQVKKFAAKVARKQGRLEDKKHLQKAFKSFLQTERGRSNVTAKDDMLSLGGASAPPQAQTVAQASAEPPAQARLSLFDLAEAAATLSTASLAPPNSKPTKGRAQAANDTVAIQSAPAVPKGPRSVRKSKGQSSSPDAEGIAAAAGVSANRAAAASDGMQTRGLATRRPSVEKQPSGRSALPSKPKAKANQVSKAHRQSPHPSIAHTASDATQDTTPAVSKPQDPAQALAALPSTSDRPEPKEELPSTAAPAPMAQLASKSGRLSHPVQAPEVTEHTISEPGHSLSLGEGLAGGPWQEAAAESTSQAAVEKPKKNKRKLKEEHGNSNQPASHAQALTAAAAAGGKAVPAAEKQHSPNQQNNSVEQSTAEALTGAAAPSQAAAEPAALGGSGSAAHQPDAIKGKKKKKKRKHREGEQTEAALESDAQAPSTAAMSAAQASVAAPTSEAVQGQAAGELPVEAASKPKKKKKQKHGEAAGVSRQTAAPSPAAAAEAATAPADEAVVPNAGEPAASQADFGVKTKKKKKKKKRKHSEAEWAGLPIHSAPSASHAASAEVGPSGAATDSAATAAETSTAQHDAAALASEPAAAVKPKKLKLKHKDAQAQQAAAAGSTDHNAAPTKAAAVETGSEPSQQSAAAVHSAAHTEEAAPKVKGKHKSKGPATVPGAEAAIASAEEAAVAAAGPAAAQKVPGRQSNTASPADIASTSVLAAQSSWRENAKRQDVKKGKFTKQEKDTLKQAAIAYAQENNLPTTDFAWLFCTRSLNSEYKGQATGAWRSISESLPHRTNKAVYACGTRMLHERNYQGKWSKEDDEQLRQLVSDKGSKWAEISRSLNRLPEGCRDRWRELKLGDAKLNGRWSKDETERLRCLVNAYMSQKQANEEQQSSGGGGLSLTLDDLESGLAQADDKPSDGRIILDDIDWDLISEQHGTRSAAQCLTKWYTQLAPSMVTKGEWGSGDDRRLLRALLKTGAAEDFQVDWGQLVATRTAQQARRRWRLMLKCVKDSKDREFSDNLKTLVTTFTPDLLLPSPPKPAKARTSKKCKGKEVAKSAADDYPGMSGGMY